MTGMKEGAGEDPFAEDAEPQDSSGVDDGRDGEATDGTDDDGAPPEDSESAEAGRVAERDGSNSSRQSRDPGTPPGRDGRNAETADAAEGTPGQGSMEEEVHRPADEARGTTMSATREGRVDIPYKLRRDSVQDGRKRVPLFLQDETKADERDVLRELEDRFDDNVSLTDLREALILVGMGRLDEVEDQLEQWGYGMTFDV